MTLQDLIRRFRVLARDAVLPYLWSDEDVTDWLNDAQRQACIRGRLIRESNDDAVCRIDMTPGQQSYDLHPLAYEIISAWLHPVSGRPCLLELHSREWLDRNHPGWRSHKHNAWALVQDDTSITLAGRINAGDVLRLECYKLPEDMELSSWSEPEIHMAHHEHLIQWALHKAFSVVDTEVFDPERAERAALEFTRYFGLQPDSDMRRITREDQPHHNEAILP